jgi:Protein of unknown function (DUF3040)
MSLSAWEQRALDSIKDGLAGSDPQLAALLTAFALPSSRVKLQWVAPVLWLVITAALIAVALTLGHNGSQGTCPGAWPAICSHSGPG